MAGFGQGGTGFSGGGTDVLSASERRVFGIPGASLEFAHTLDEGARTAGAEGEVRVAEELERLAALYPNTYVFHSVKLPRHEGDIDHIVVRGNKILLVDSKNWKFNAGYHIEEIDSDYAYILRDNEEFVGGDIHLPFQISDWQKTIGRMDAVVTGTVVIANRRSKVFGKSRTSKFSLTNIDGLADTFAQIFTDPVVPPLKKIFLKYFISLMQNPDGTSLPTPVVQNWKKLYSKERTMRTTRWFVLWGFLNTLAVFAGPVSYITTIPFLVVAHMHRSKLKRLKSKGAGSLTAAMIWNYLIAGLWLLIIIFLKVMDVF